MEPSDCDARLTSAKREKNGRISEEELQTITQFWAVHQRSSISSKIALPWHPCCAQSLALCSLGKCGLGEYHGGPVSQLCPHSSFFFKEIRVEHLHGQHSIKHTHQPFKNKVTIFWGKCVGVSTYLRIKA